MFFTQILLNTSRRATIKALNSKQVLHAAILSGFPYGNRDEKNKITWRIDDASRHDIRIFVVSDKKPDYTNFWENYGWSQLPYSETVKTTSYSNLLEKISNGQEWGFRLKANTIKQNNGKKIALTDDDINTWLHKREKNNGFNTKELKSDTKTVSFYKRNQNKVTIQETVFEGTLVIENVEDFKYALINGIGGAKAYGCGLLTLAK